MKDSLYGIPCLHVLHVALCFPFCVGWFLLKSAFLKLVKIFVFFVFILVDAFGFLVLWLHPDREIIENLFTVRENILRKKTFVHLLELRRNFIAGTKWAISGGQYCSILVPRIARHSMGLGSSCQLTELIIVMIIIINNYSISARWI